MVKTKLEKEYINFVERMFAKYAPILFLEKYHLSVEKSKEADEYLASRFAVPYLDLTILYSEKAIRDWQENKVDAERRIIHEFCHAITDPFYGIATERCVTKLQINDARERLTDHIAQIVHKNLKT